MIDFEELIRVMEEIRSATEDANADSDDVLDLFGMVTTIFRKWSVGVTAEHRNEDGRVLAFQRYGKAELFQFVVQRSDAENRISIGQLKRHEKLDIVHQLLPLLHNIHGALVEQKAASTTLGDVVARLERLWDKDENT
jgi:hypothetical protein